MAAKSVKIKRIKFHNQGFNELRKSPEIANELEARGEQIAAAAEAVAGGLFIVNIEETKSRARVSIVTADEDARRAEADMRALTGALDAGRD